MNKKQVGIIILLLCFCFALIPHRALAASTADAVEPIATADPCDLTLVYRYDNTPFTEIPVKIYKIAQISADFQYSLAPNFKSTELSLNGIRTSGEWKVVRSTLEAHIIANSIEADISSATDQNGQIRLEDLEAGLYLAIVGQATQSGSSCRFDSALLSLPDLGADGRWVYDVTAVAKAELLPPTELDKEIELKVIKLWRGDEGRSTRPKSIEIKIFRDGLPQTTAILSEANNWSYVWSAKDDGADWTVAEVNVPVGYSVTVEERDGAFILTNTFITSDPTDPEKPPETGDSANILSYILLMSVSGLALIAIGTAGQRKII